MTALNASEMGIPPQTLDEVACEKERIRIDRGNGQSVYLVSEEDYRRLEAIEDRYWAEEGQRALDEFERSGKPGIPWEKTKAELGL